MTGAKAPTVAVVGRQNVGKSTLINRLVGRRGAIAHSRAGVTRDRVGVPLSWRGRQVLLIDTAGYLSSARGLEALAIEQADKALVQADLILLVVDSQAGVTEEDATIAKRLRRLSAPVLVVANKVDSELEESDALDFLGLGLGEPVSVSGLHGRSTGDLLDRMLELLPRNAGRGGGAGEDESMPRFSIVGRPNVGKSTLFNKLVGQERSLVHESAGTTRDPVDEVVLWADGPVRFIDTAGLRRQVKVRGIEYFSLVRTTQTIARSDVSVLVIDATEGFSAEDKKIANKVMEAGRAFLLVANKWDLVQDKDKTFKGLAEEMGPFAKATALRTSALRGQGLPRLPQLLTELHARWGRRIPTSRVNELIQRAQRERPIPRLGGTIHYATQVDVSPPTFVLFASKEPNASYGRFLENRLRAEFGFEGVPIRLRFRTRKAPARRD